MGATARVLQIVHSSFGVRNAFGARAFYIDRSLQKEEVLILARHWSPEAKSSFRVLKCGYGDIAGKLLKAAHVYISSSVPHKKILQRRFVADAARHIERVDTSRLSLIHTWTPVPDVLRLAKSRKRDIQTLLDISMCPVECLEDRGRAFREEARAIDYFVTPSDIATQMLVSSCGIARDRVFTVPFGVDPELFKPPQGRPEKDAAGEIRAADCGGFSVAFSGHVDRRKGIPELVEAWKMLSLPQSELHLYGRVYPEVREALQGARHHGIRLHGFVDTARELPKNHLFVLPTYKEGSAKAVYEALASGIPVVTTPEAGSIVRDGIEGKIVRAGDTRAIAEAIRFYYENEAARRDAALAARRRALEFTWERYSKSIVEIYRKIGDPAIGT